MTRYRVRRRHMPFLAVIVAFILWVGQSQGWFNAPKQAVETNQPGLYSINHFVDGDTVAVNMNGKSETVRFIGVDTPETHKPNTPVQCYGPAAAAYTKNLITAAGSKVRLDSDAKSTNRDRYNRLLRYVYLPDGKLVNEELIKNGYGFYYPYFPFTKSAQFKADEDQAMAAKKGLWTNCKPIPSGDGGYKSPPESQS